MVDRGDGEEDQRGGREDGRADPGRGVGGERDQDDACSEREGSGGEVEPAAQVRLGLGERLVDRLRRAVDALVEPVEPVAE